MNPASQKKLCFIAFRLYVVSIVTAFCLSFVPMDPMLCIGLKVLLLFLALFFYALHAKNNENHAYLDPKALRAMHSTFLPRASCPPTTSSASF